MKTFKKPYVTLIKTWIIQDGEEVYVWMLWKRYRTQKDAEKGRKDLYKCASILQVKIFLISMFDSLMK